MKCPRRADVYNKFNELIDLGVKRSNNSSVNVEQQASNAGRGF